jgi:hypothetical protein
VPTRPTESAARWLPWAALATVLLSLAVGAWQHWTLSLAMVGAARLLTWLLLGTYATVPLLAIGAAIIRLVDRRIFELPVVVAVATSVAAGATAVVLTGILLLATGLYTPLVWQVVALAAWLVSVAWLVARRWQPLDALWRELRRHGELPLRPLSWTALLVIVTGLAALHATLPPDTRDELSYHLAVPEMWAFQGDWWLPTDNFHTLFPGNCELLWGWAAAVGGPLAPRFLTLLLAALTVALLVQWMAGAGTSRWSRDVSLVFLLVTPVVLTAAVICYVEWPMLLLLLLGWRLSRIGLDSAGAVAPIWPALLWGAAAGMKYTALLFVGLLSLEWILSVGRRRGVRAAVTAALLGTVAAAILAGPWLARNVSATGDPVYPLGAAMSTSADSPHDPSDLSGYARLDGAWRWMPWSFHATAETIVDHRLHPLWPLLHLLVLALGWRWRRDLPWFTVIGASVALAWFQPAPRIYLPLMLLAWLFLPGLLDALPADRKAPRSVAGAAVGLVALASIPLAFHYLFVPGGSAVPSYLIGLSDRAGYLRARGELTPAMERIASHSDPEARIWTWCEDRTLYFDRWTRSDSPYGPPSWLVAVGSGGAAALDREIDAWGIDLVVLRHDRCPETFAGYRLDRHAAAVDPSLRDAVTAWSAGRLRELDRDDHYVTFEVLR